MKWFLRLFLGFLLLVLLYFGSIMAYGMLTDWQPTGTMEAEMHRTALPTEQIVPDSNLHFCTWNLGYGSDGAKSDFFFDDEGLLTSGNSMVYSPLELTKEYIGGGLQYVHGTHADFFLLQEMDCKSDRSYNIPQFDLYADTLAGFSAVFAPNYKVNRVPIPLLEPWNCYGAVLSGLATYSRFQPTENVRHQLPGSYPLPDRIFQLDRCLLVQRYKVANGKELVVINLHNSAYDKGGRIKKLQLPYLRDVALKAHEKGDYVIIGGDWNQCPPDVVSTMFRPNEVAEEWESSLPRDFFPANWTYVYDKKTPTNRKLADAYIPNETFVTLIDFYLVSPNVKIDSVRTKDQQFAFSDHQPVEMWVDLK